MVLFSDCRTYQLAWMRDAAGFDRLSRLSSLVSWPGISSFALSGGSWELWPWPFRFQSSKTAFASSCFPCSQTMSIRASSQTAPCTTSEAAPSSSCRWLFSFLSSGCCGDLSNGTVTTYLLDCVLSHDRGILQPHYEPP